MIARAEGRPVPGFPGYYASEDGRVFTDLRLHPDGSLREHRQYPDREGYPRVRFIRDGKRSWIKVAKVIAMTYMSPKPSANHQIRHLDGNNKNNAAWNLSWGTAKQNCHDRDGHGTTVKGIRHHATHLKPLDIVTIRGRCSLGERQKDIASDFGVSPVTVSRIARRKWWRHVG